MPRNQASRRAAVITPLGDDVLLLKKMSATEELGRLFHFDLELLSEQREIKFEGIVGQNATVRLTLPDGKTRYFNGFVSRFAQMPDQDHAACYRATLVPWLWFLTRLADCRIFQEMTAPEIVQQVFRDQNFTDFKLSLSGNYRKRDFCVQYRETDFNFVSRLMEAEGIYYFFEHENGKHTLVLADSKSAHAVFPGYDTIPFRPGDASAAEQESVYEWVLEQEVQPGVVSLNDFDFEKPNKALAVKASVSRSHAASNFELFDYPGDYVEYGDGEAYARRRIEELQVAFELARGGTHACGVAPGSLFTLERHPRADQNREYLAVAANYKITADPYGSSERPEPDDFFDCRFTAMNSDTPFRAARHAVKPTVKGPQTAMVVGPSGEEIYTDKHGRVKVQFHWDRRGQADENSSCWLRVSQYWAGKNWGAIYIPRIGQEVIVDFLEGDPDRPIITGRVYNGESMPPYSLPDQKTIATVKSNSSKGGKGFNEIRFEDKKGEEQLFIHAEKNQDIRVKNHVYEWVGGNRHLIVGHDQIEQVKEDRHEVVERDHVEKIGRDRNLLVTGKEAKQIDGSHSFTVKGDVIEVFKQNHSETVSRDYYLKADNLVLEALTNITIKVGDTFIALESSGIKIGTTGQMVLEGQGPMSLETKAALDIKALSASVAGQTSLDLKSAATTVAGDMTAELKGGATTTIKGGVVMIN
jgi:type VI secretion system secreted protein VgrG